MTFQLQNVQTSEGFQLFSAQGGEDWDRRFAPVNYFACRMCFPYQSNHNTLSMRWSQLASELNPKIIVVKFHSKFIQNVHV